MTIEAALFQYLTSAGTHVKDIIGNRLYPLMIPTNTDSPSMTYQRLGGGTEVDHSGAIYKREALMQFYCFAKGTTTTASGVAQAYKAAKQLSNALIQDLVGFKGVMSGLVDIQYCNLSNEVDGDEMEDGIYVRCDFRINYREV